MSGSIERCLHALYITLPLASACLSIEVGFPNWLVVDKDEIFMLNCVYMLEFFSSMVLWSTVSSCHVNEESRSPQNNSCAKNLL